jgi:hypothetical protein
MTVERSDVGAVQDRLLAARSALAQATTREAMAAALMDECECMLDRQSLAQRARTDFATVRAARVLRGTLSPEHALQELRALENINVGALEALVDALPDDSLGALLRPPFGPGLVDARVVLEELYRRGRFDLAIELAPAGLRRPLLISWAELCARTTDEQRSAALRAADEAIARDSIAAPIQQPQEQYARFLALRRLCDRALLEPPATRAPWIARLSEALDRDVAIALMYQSEGLLRARIAIARLECGELDAAMTDFAQVYTSASAVLSQSIYGAWDFGAALSALQRSLTPEALDRVEDALVSTLEANVNVARHVWFSLAKRLRTTARERAFVQAMRARSWGEWGDLYWLDEVPSNVCADAVARGVAALPALAEQHARRSFVGRAQRGAERGPRDGPVGRGVRRARRSGVARGAERAVVRGALRASLALRGRAQGKRRRAYSDPPRRGRDVRPVARRAALVPRLRRCVCRPADRGAGRSERPVPAQRVADGADPSAHGR